MSEDRKALDRAQQYLANERTFLSWLRTSIALIGLGFIIARFGLFLREFQLLVQLEASQSGSPVTETLLSSILGVLMVALGIALIIYSLKSYRNGNREIEKGIFTPKNGIVHTGAILLAIFGGIIVVYLLIVSLL